ncbi:MAG: hypothetical protein ACE5R6_13910 [Candidatus Heimdallarchaeota archaeon]
MILIKGWKVVRQPNFILPLIIATIAITFWHNPRGIAGISVVVLAYLHWRYDLSDYLGIHSKRWHKADMAAILFVGLLSSVPRFLDPSPYSLSIDRAFVAAIDRLFANPASTVENFFYFGFLAERLSHKTGRWWTPLIIGLMYTAHEMSNPEYWYEGMSFVLVFLAVAIFTVIYLWRRNALVLWLGSGLGRLFSNLI